MTKKRRLATKIWECCLFSLSSIMVTPGVVSAESGDRTGMTRFMIEKAFQPVVELLQGIAYPVAILMISGGFIAFILGQRNRGLEMIKWAIIGYLGLQLAPALMEIIVEVGAAMKTN